MFVKSKMSIPVKYHKNSKCYVIKPNTITYIDDVKVSPKELLDCYGQRIEIISSKMAQDYQQPQKEEPIKEQPKLEKRKEDLTDDSLAEILKQVESELKEKEEALEQPSNEVEAQDSPEENVEDLKGNKEEVPAQLDWEIELQSVVQPSEENEEDALSSSQGKETLKGTQTNETLSEPQVNDDKTPQKPVKTAKKTTSKKGSRRGSKRTAK